MASTLNTLKIQVPAQRPAPQNAALVGEFAVQALSAAQTACAALLRLLQNLSPSSIRAEMSAAAAALKASQPGTAAQLLSLSKTAWTH